MQIKKYQRAIVAAVQRWQTGNVRVVENDTAFNELGWKTGIIRGDKEDGTEFSFETLHYKDLSFANEAIEELGMNINPISPVPEFFLEIELYPEGLQLWQYELEELIGHKVLSREMMMRFGRPLRIFWSPFYRMDGKLVVIKRVGKTPEEPPDWEWRGNLRTFESEFFDENGDPLTPEQVYNRDDNREWDYYDVDIEIGDPKKPDVFHCLYLSLTGSHNHYTIDLARADKLGLLDPVDGNSKAHNARSPGNSKISRWEPTPGYIGVIEIMSHERFRKKGKNPPRTTIDAWINQSRNGDDPVSIEKAPDTQEVHLPESWVFKRIQIWSPRT